MPGHRDLWVVGAMLGLLLLLWLGYAWHRDPRFAGSAWGVILGVASGLGMLVPAAYALVKRVPWLRARRSLAPWLTAHVYVGVVAATLGVLHSGHRFDSLVGQALVALSLLVVLTGYLGRHLSRLVVDDLRTRKDHLLGLHALWARALDGAPAAAATPGRNAAAELDDLARALADATHATQAADALRLALKRWLGAHIALSVALYAALAVHIWSAWQHSGRWWPWG